MALKNKERTQFLNKIFPPNIILAILGISLNKIILYWACWRAYLVAKCVNWNLFYLCLNFILAKAFAVEKIYTFFSRRIHKLFIFSQSTRWGRRDNWWNNNARIAASGWALKKGQVTRTRAPHAQKPHSPFNHYQPNERILCSASFSSEITAVR